MAIRQNLIIKLLADPARRGVGRDKLSTANLQLLKFP